MSGEGVVVEGVRVYGRGLWVDTIEFPRSLPDFPPGTGPIQTALWLSADLSLSYPKPYFTKLYLHKKMYQKFSTQIPAQQGALSKNKIKFFYKKRGVEGSVCICIMYISIYTLRECNLLWMVTRNQQVNIGASSSLRIRIALKRRDDNLNSVRAPIVQPPTKILNINLL